MLSIPVVSSSPENEKRETAGGGCFYKQAGVSMGGLLPPANCNHKFRLLVFVVSEQIRC